MKKYYAELNNDNIVINIIVADEHFTNASFQEYSLDNPAYIGGDFFNGYFYPPQPFPSWNRENGNWIAPKQKPEGFGWFWNEKSGEWINA